MQRFLLFFLVLSIYIINQFAFAQTKATIKNIAFEGAGIRGIAYAGVVAELEQQKIISSITNVGGTSAGAIIALALSLGYSAQELEYLVAATNFKKFNDGRYIFFGGINRMNKNFGWYRTDKFQRWIEKIIIKKTSNPNITFQQLHDLGYKDLFVTGTSLSQQKLVTFSRHTFPNMKIKDAVRISMTIPLYFEAAWINEIGDVIKRPKHTTGLQLMIDGGVLGNFPINIWDSITSSGQRIINPETIGVRIDTDEQITSDNLNQHLASQDIKTIRNFVSAFYILVLENLNRNQLTEEDWNRTISVSSGNIKPRIKKLSTQQKKQLIANGKNGTIHFLQKIK